VGSAVLDQIDLDTGIKLMLFLAAFGASWELCCWWQSRRVGRRRKK
jgi:hypothetical protein